MQAVIRHVNPECGNTPSRVRATTRSMRTSTGVPHCGWIENRPVMACSADATAGQNSRHVEIHDRRLGQLMCLRSRDPADVMTQSADMSPPLKPGGSIEPRA